MNLIYNDNIECYVTINEDKTTIDGTRTPIIENKKFYCSFEALNKISYDTENVQTIARGSVRINGDILKKDYNVYDGTVTLLGATHNIVSIKRCRNLFNSNIVDFTEIIVE